MTDYPECEKMLAHRSESFILSAFFEWLLTDEKFSLCKKRKIRVLGEVDHEFVPIGESRFEKVLARYFGIDLDKIEKERSQMLEEQRLLNERIPR